MAATAKEWARVAGLGASSTGSSSAKGTMVVVVDEASQEVAAAPHHQQQQPLTPNHPGAGGSLEFIHKVEERLVEELALEGGGDANHLRLPMQDTQDPLGAAEYQAPAPTGASEPEAESGMPENVKEDPPVFRSAQDELHKSLGGGCRGRGKGKGRGRGRKKQGGENGEAEVVEPAAEEPKGAEEENEEEDQEEEHTPEGGERSIKNRYPVRPAPKSRATAKAKGMPKNISPMARRTRKKASPKAKAKAGAKAGAKAKSRANGGLARKLFASDEEGEGAGPKRKARKVEPKDSEEPSHSKKDTPKRPKRKSRKGGEEDKQEGSPKRRARKTKVQVTDGQVPAAAVEDAKGKEPEPQRRTRRRRGGDGDGGRRAIPEFKLCSVEIYWERPACGLKVQCELVGKNPTKTGLTQARKELLVLDVSGLLFVCPECAHRRPY